MPYAGFSHRLRIILIAGDNLVNLTCPIFSQFAIDYLKQSAIRVIHIFFQIPQLFVNLPNYSA